MNRKTFSSALVDKLLAIPGVTESVLRKAIYRLRRRQGLCTKGNGSCNKIALPNKPLCERHTELQNKANERFQRSA